MKAFTLALSFMLLVFSGTALVASADGNGSPFACFDGPTFEGNANHIEYTTPDGYLIESVCISSVDNHTDPLADGTYDRAGALVAADSSAACYSIEGVGTQTLKIDSPMDGSGCQTLNHIDIITVCDACAEDESAVEVVSQAEPSSAPAAEVQGVQQGAPLQAFETLPFAGSGPGDGDSGTLLLLGLVAVFCTVGLAFGFASRRQR